MSTFNVALEEVVRDASVSPREAVDAGRVQEFMELYVHGGVNALPPIVVSYLPDVDGEEQCVLVDGWHRVEAAHRLNRKELPAKEFDAADDADVFREATRLSATGSKPLTVAEKRKAVSKLLVDFPEASDRSIAKDAGVSHTYAANRRRELNLPSGNVATSDDAEEGVASRKNAPKLTAEQAAIKLMRDMKNVVAGGFFLFNKDGNMSKVLSEAALNECGDNAASTLADIEKWVTGAKRICENTALAG